MGDPTREDGKWGTDLVTTSTLGMYDDYSWLSTWVHLELTKTPNYGAHVWGFLLILKGEYLFLILVSEIKVYNFNSVLEMGNWMFNPDL